MHDQYETRFLLFGWRRWMLVVALLISAAAIGVLDYFSGPELALSVLYLIPITIAAWRLGRVWALTIAALDIIPTYLDQAGRIEVGEYTYFVVIANVVVRGLIYVYVAELVYRLVRSRAELSSTTEQLSDAYNVLEQDVEAAKLLQATVLENPIPQVPGFDIATRLMYTRKVGGDFWEAVRLDDALHVIVADVSGKGVPAALFTTLLKHLLEEARDISGDPAEIVSQINAQLGRRLPETMFVSLFYGCLDTRTGRLAYINAGHEPAMLYRARTDDVEELGSTVMIMGLDGYDDRPQSMVTTLEPGDIMLLYTDGITDAKMPSGERLGHGFLRDVVRDLHDQPADGLVDGVVERMEQATLSSSRDDVTLVCIKAVQE